MGISNYWILLFEVMVIFLFWWTLRETKFLWDNISDIEGKIDDLLLIEKSKNDLLVHMTTIIKTLNAEVEFLKKEYE